MSAWDDDDFTPTIPGAKNTTTAKKAEVKDSWDDEDAPSTNLQVKGQWDDEDAAPEPEAPKPKAEVKKPAPKPKKAAAKAATSSSSYVSSGDPLADKMREQRLVEAADFENVEDMFGIERKQEEVTGGEDLLNSKPKTELEYDSFARELVKRLSVHETSFHYPFFVKSITKQLCATFTKPEDIKEIITALNVLSNERLKSEKPKATKSKKAAGPTAGKKLYKEAFDADFDTKGKYTGDDDDDDFM